MDSEVEQVLDTLCVIKEQFDKEKKVIDEMLLAVTSILTTEHSVKKITIGVELDDDTHIKYFTREFETGKDDKRSEYDIRILNAAKDILMSMNDIKRVRRNEIERHLLEASVLLCEKFLGMSHTKKA